MHESDDSILIDRAPHFLLNVMEGEKNFCAQIYNLDFIRSLNIDIQLCIARGLDTLMMSCLIDLRFVWVTLHFSYISRISKKLQMYKVNYRWVGVYDSP